MKYRLAVMWSLVIGLMSSATAQEISAADAQAIRVVVQSQLDAFSEDDAVKAFNLASTSTRSQLGTPDNFLNLVKKQYPVIYRHRWALFSNPEIVDGEALQSVRLTDSDNL